jgi:gamma-glutamylcyclotransferase
MHIRVFSYGSNLCIARMLARVPSGRPLVTASVEAYALRFHKHGRDGSGKADAFFTGARDDVVWGAVYEIDAADKRALDRIEGLGSHYLEREVSLVTAVGARLDAWMYYASPQRIVEGLKPYGWYHRFVVEGARQHRLPAAYIAALEAVEFVDDPDGRRHARELAVLEGVSDR